MAAGKMICYVLAPQQWQSLAQEKKQRQQTKNRLGKEANTTMKPITLQWNQNYCKETTCAQSALDCPNRQRSSLLPFTPSFSVAKPAVTVPSVVAPVNGVVGVIEVVAGGHTAVLASFQTLPFSSDLGPRHSHTCLPPSCCPPSVAGGHSDTQWPIGCVGRHGCNCSKDLRWGKFTRTRRSVFFLRGRTFSTE